MMNKLKIFFTLTILTMMILPALSAPVTVKRKIPTAEPTAPLIEEKTQKPKSPELTSEQKLNKIKQYARNYVKKQPTLDEDKIGADYCEMKFTMQDMGAENINLTVFNPKYVYKDKVETGFKYNGIIYRHVKRCIKLEFTFENKEYFTGYCK